MIRNLILSFKVRENELNKKQNTHEILFDLLKKMIYTW